MDEVKTYWRDSAIKLAAWGTGILLAVGGWAMLQSDQFELRVMATPRERGRAILLLVFAFAGTICWSFALRWIYKTHLIKDVDATVIEWRFMRIYAFVVSACTWILAFLTAFR